MTESAETFMKYVGGPLVTAALGAAGFWLQDRLKRKTDQASHDAARFEAMETLNFMEKWLQTQQLVCSPEEFELIKQAARERLNKLDADLHRSREKKAKTNQRPLWKRIFLLYSPKGFLSWVAHGVFYLCAFFALLISTGVPDMFNEVWHQESLGSAIAVLLFFLAVVFALLLLLRAAAVALDKRYSNQMVTVSSPAQSPESKA